MEIFAQTLLIATMKAYRRPLRGPTPTTGGGNSAGDNGSDDAPLAADGVPDGAQAVTGDPIATGEE